MYRSIEASTGATTINSTEIIYPMYERIQFSYTALFCEENIWLLGFSLGQQGIPMAALSAVVLSNPEKSIA
jgi:hypothetical protein